MRNDGRPTATRHRGIAGLVALGLLGGIGWASLGTGQGAAALLASTDQQNNQSVCDADGLLTELRSNDTMAAGWARVLHIRTANLPDFVASLRPQVLPSDTPVTEHVFDDGRFLPRPAVLPEGTEVLADTGGDPAVNCTTGNPLTESRSGPSTPGTTRSGTPYGVAPGSAANPGAGTAPAPGAGPGATPQPKPVDPRIEAARKKAQDAFEKVEQARKAATEARAKANDLKGKADAAGQEHDRLTGILTAKQNELTAAQTKFLEANKAATQAEQEAAADPNNPDKKLRALQLRNFANETKEQVGAKVTEVLKANADQKQAGQAKQELENRHRMADSAARSAEGTVVVAEQEFGKAKTEFEDVAGVPFKPAPVPAPKDQPEKDAGKELARLRVDDESAEQREPLTRTAPDADSEAVEEPGQQSQSPGKSQSPGGGQRTNPSTGTTMQDSAGTQ